MAIIAYKFIYNLKALLIDNFEEVSLNQLMRDAQNRKEMEEIIEEATKLATKTEIME